MFGTAITGHATVVCGLKANMSDELDDEVPARGIV